jgi:hypothetical protein
VPTWIDLVDPEPAELREALPEHVHATAMAALHCTSTTTSRAHNRVARGLRARDPAAAGRVPADRLYYQSLKLVATMNALDGVEDAPGEAVDPAPAKEAPLEDTGMCLPPCRRGGGGTSTRDALDDEMTSRGLVAESSQQRSPASADFVATCSGPQDALPARTRSKDRGRAELDRGGSSPGVGIAFGSAFGKKAARVEGWRGPRLAGGIQDYLRGRSRTIRTR